MWYYFTRHHSGPRSTFSRWTGVFAAVSISIASVVTTDVFTRSAIAAETATNPALTDPAPSEVAKKTGVPWTATDALDRTTVSPGEVVPQRTVGIFYFLWHEAGAEVRAPWNDGPYDIMKILERDSDALSKPDSPYWGHAVGSMHYWGEPIWGYYRADDPWVLRRHAILLTDAGIDMVIFDTTNAVTYAPIYRALCRVWDEMRQEGEQVPQIAFMVNTQAGKTARQIYDDLYRTGEFRDLWFIWNGKPLMICDPADADADMKEFFTLRRAHWPFTMVNTDRAWHWEAAYPQPYGFVDDPAKPEQVNVSVAQNLRSSPDAQVTNMSDGNARGRSFYRGQEKPEIATDEGRNFAEQWQRAYELTPPFVMVTGWNEWIAGNWGEPGKTLKFVDQFNREYSRDIEPMKDGHGDDYYLQLIAGIRGYKGAPSLPAAPQPKTIDVDGDFSQWNDVVPELRDHIGETAPRDWDGVGGTHYVNATGRNDIVCCRFTGDAKNLYFYLETAAPMRFDSAAGRPDALTLLIALRSAESEDHDWLGSGFRVVADPDSPTPFVLERRTVTTAATAAGWERTPDAVTYRLEGNRLQLSIPRNGISPTNVPLRDVRFKWLDHCCVDGWNAEELYTHGDVAPESRFFYEFR